MEVKVNALCVKTIDYKDNDRLITLSTIERGKILVKATGCKLPKAKLKFSASPLCFGEYSLIETNGRYILKGCELIDSFASLANDLNRYYAGFTVLECTDKLSKEDDTETCRALTLTAVNALKTIAYDENISPEAALVNYYKNILSAAGYGLNFTTCAVSGKPLEGRRICFDFTYSGIVLYECRSVDYVDLTDELISALNFPEEQDAGVLRGLLTLLDEVLSKTAYVQRSYSLSQLIKL